MPTSSIEYVVSAHSVVLPGKGWASIYAAPTEEAVSAFTSDAAGACGVEESNVFNVTIGGPPLIVRCSIRHPLGQARDVLDFQLQSCGFPALARLAADHSGDNVSRERSGVRGRSSSHASDVESTDGSRAHSGDGCGATRTSATHSGMLSESNVDTASQAIRVIFQGEMWTQVLAHHQHAMEVVAQVDVDECLAGRFGDKAPVCRVFFQSDSDADEAQLYISTVPPHPSVEETDEMKAALTACSFNRTWGKFVECRAALGDGQGHNNDGRGVPEASGNDAESTSLYKEWVSTSRVNSIHHVRFESSNFTVLATEKRGALQQAIVMDVVDAVQVPAQAVVIEKFATDGALVVTLGVEHPVTMNAAHVTAVLDTYPFPRVWALHNSFFFAADIETITQDTGRTEMSKGSFQSLQRSGDIPVPEFTTTRHQVVLPGSRWDEVIAAGDSHLRDAFVYDAVEVLGLPTASAVRVSHVAVGSLVIEAYVRHGADLSREEVKQRLNTAPCRHLWRLYYEAIAENIPRGDEVFTDAHGEKSPTSTTTTTTHTVRLPGNDWAVAVEQRYFQLREAVRFDAATAMNVPVDSVGKILLSTGSLVANLEVRHAAGVSHDVMDDRLNSHTYPLAKDVLAEVTGHSTSKAVTNGDGNDTGLAVTKHALHLDGDWEATLESHPVEVEDSLRGDVAEHLGLHGGAIKVKTVTAHAGLQVRFDIEHAAGVSKREINQQLQTCGYQRTWALLEAHERLAAEGATVVQSTMRRYTVTLDGDWGRVLQERGADLHAAFVADIARATGTPEEAVSNLTFVQGSLKAEFSLAHDSSVSSDEIKQRLQHYEFPETVNLFNEVTWGASHDAYTTTRHRVRFEGEGWAPTYEGNPQALVRAFCEDVQDATRFPPEEDNVTVQAGSETMVMDFILHHPQSVEAAHINDALATTLYPKTRALYVRADSQTNVVTSHAVSLEGDDWDRVVREKKPELERALRDDVSESIGVPIENVGNLDFGTNGLEVTFNVTHSKALKRKEISKALAACPYERTWALYQPVVDEAAPEAHVRGLSLTPQQPALQAYEEVAPKPLPGSTSNLRRDPALTAYEQQQPQAIVRGLHHKLPVEEAPAVTNPTPVSRVTTDIENPRETVLPQLYKSPPAPLSANGPSSPSLTTSQMKKAFISLDNDEPSVALYSRDHQAPTLRASDEEAPRLARVGTPVEATERSLPVAAAAREPAEPLNDTESFMSLDNDEPMANDVHGSTVEHHEFTLEGSKWGRVLDDHEEHIVNAVRTDAAKALGVSEDQIRNISVRAGSLIASFDVVGAPAGQSHADRKEVLDKYHYPTIWNLYPPPTPEEEELPAHRAAPVAREPAEALNDTESFMSLDNEEPMAPLEAAEARAAPLRADDEELPVLRASDEEAPRLARVGTPVEATERSLPVAAAAREPAEPLNDTESFMSLDNEEPMVPLRAATEELPMLRADEEDFPVLRASDEEAPRLARVGTPVEATERSLPVAAAAREPAEPLNDTESFMSLDNDEPMANDAHGSTVEHHEFTLEGSKWGRVLDDHEEHIVNAVRTDAAKALGVSEDQIRNISVRAGSLIASFDVVGAPAGQSHADRKEVLDKYHYPTIWNLYPPPTPEEEELPAHRAAPVAREPADALNDTESFMSLDNEEPMAPLEAAEARAAPLRAHDEELPVLRASDEEAPRLARVGTPVEATERSLPVAAAAREPAEPLNDTESFMSLDNEEPMAPLEAAEARAAPLRAHDEELPVLRASDEEAPRLARVGTPVEATEHSLPVAAAAREPAEPLNDTESFMSLDNEEPMAPLEAAEARAAPLRAHDEELPVLRASDEEAPRLARVGTPVEATERSLPVAAAAREPAEPLNDTESFMSLDNDEPMANDVHGSTVEHHEFTLEGSKWGRVLDDHEEHIVNAVRTDAAKALGVSEDQIRNISVRAGSLIASFDVVGAPAGQSHADRKEVLDKYHYPTIWNLYPPPTPEEEELPAHRAAPVAREPADALNDTESFMSLDNEEPMAPLEAAEARAAPLRAHDEELPVLRASDEEAPRLARVGTPVEATERSLPVAAAAREPAEPLNDTESFMSLDNEEPMAPLEAAEARAAPLRAHDEELPVLRASDEEAPRLARVGTPVEATERSLPVAAAAHEPAEPLNDTESFISLDDRMPEGTGPKVESLSPRDIAHTVGDEVILAHSPGERQGVAEDGMVERERPVEGTGRPGCPQPVNTGSADEVLVSAPSKTHLPRESRRMEEVEQLKAEEKVAPSPHTPSATEADEVAITGSQAEAHPMESRHMEEVEQLKAEEKVAPSPHTPSATEADEVAITGSQAEAHPMESRHMEEVEQLKAEEEVAPSPHTPSATAADEVAITGSQAEAHPMESRHMEEVEQLKAEEEVAPSPHTPSATAADEVAITGSQAEAHPMESRHMEEVEQLKAEEEVAPSPHTPSATAADEVAITGSQAEAHPVESSHMEEVEQLKAEEEVAPSPHTPSATAADEVAITGSQAEAHPMESRHMEEVEQLKAEEEVAPSPHTPSATAADEVAITGSQAEAHPMESRHMEEVEQLKAEEEVAPSPHTPSATAADEVAITGSQAEAHPMESRHMEEVEQLKAEEEVAPSPHTPSATAADEVAITGSQAEAHPVESSHMEEVEQLKAEEEVAPSPHTPSATAADEVAITGSQDEAHPMESRHMEEVEQLKAEEEVAPSPHTPSATEADEVAIRGSGAEAYPVESSHMEEVEQLKAEEEVAPSPHTPSATAADEVAITGSQAEAYPVESSHMEEVEQLKAEEEVAPSPHTPSATEADEVAITGSGAEAYPVESSHMEEVEQLKAEEEVAPSPHTPSATEADEVAIRDSEAEAYPVESSHMEEVEQLKAEEEVAPSPHTPSATEADEVAITGSQAEAHPVESSHMEEVEQLKASEEAPVSASETLRGEEVPSTLATEPSTVWREDTKAKERASSVPNAPLADQGKEAETRDGGSPSVKPQGLVTHHQLYLPGPLWGYTIRTRHEELVRAIQRDTARVTGVPRRNIIEITCREGSLLADMDIVHVASTPSKRELDDLIFKSHFTDVWKLYPTGDEQLSVSNSGVTSPRKGSGLASRRSSMPSRYSSATRRNPLYSYEQGDAGSPKTEARKRPGDGSVDAAAPPLVPSNMAESPRPPAKTASPKHYAPPIVTKEPEPPVETLVRTPEKPRNRSTSDVATQGSAASPETHASTKEPSTNTIDAGIPEAEAVRDFPAPPPEGSRRTTAKTRHRVGFVGERWPEVLATRREDFKNAFLKDTTEALNMVPNGVEKITCDEQRGDTVVAFVVVHSREIKAADVDKILRSAPYDDVWALYYEVIGVVSNNVKPVTTFHRVGFIGDGWGEVVDKDWDRFAAAFVTDTAGALNLPPTDIRLVDYTVGDDIIVDFYVTHPVSDTEVEIDNKLDQSEYSRVWDLYAVGYGGKTYDEQPFFPTTAATKNARSDQNGGQPSQPADANGTPAWLSNISNAPNYNSQPALPRIYPNLNNTAPVGDEPVPTAARRYSGSRSLNSSAVSPSHVSRSISQSYGNAPYPPRQRRLSSATRHRNRRVNLRELEGELSRKQRERAKKERREHLEKSIERAQALQRSRETGTSQNRRDHSRSNGFLPPISSRNNSYLNGAGHSPVPTASNTRPQASQRTNGHTSSRGRYKPYLDPSSGRYA